MIGLICALRTALTAVLTALALTPAVTPGTASAGPQPTLPRPDHVVVVVMENRSFDAIMADGAAPFIHSLAARGALFTRSFAVSHPSEPNYFALFTGSTWEVRDDGRYLFSAPTLASQLRAAGMSFTGYVENGSPRKHNPWRSFKDERRVERDMTAFPRDLTRLPTVSFVIPDQDDDMHDGSIAQGDAWLRQHLGLYAEWCLRHNSLLVLTFDEDDGKGDNRILTLFLGAGIAPGTYDGMTDHYAVLRTIQALYGLAPLAHSADRAPILEIWRGAGATRPPG